MTLKEKIGQLFSPAAFIHDTEENILALERLITEQNIGGITFFHSRHSAAANFEQRQEILNYDFTLEKLTERIQRFQKLAKTPLLISIDAEFGLAMRVEDTPQYPYAISLGAIPESQIKLIREVGYRIGKDLKQCGIHLNFAPVADINTNSNNPVIGYRSFGNDKEIVSKYALAMYEGIEKAGIKACYKHFPGHGDTDVDSHLGLPIIYKSKRELLDEELYPFMEGIKAGVDMIMVGHLAVPALSAGKKIPASLSKEVITDFLREELGFNGIVFTDALNMKSVSSMFPEPGQLEWEAFNAGNDILCFSENVTEGIKRIASNAEETQVDKSFQRIMDLKQSLDIKNIVPQTPIIFDWESHNSFNEKLAKHYIKVLEDNKKDDIIDCRSFAKVSLFSPLFNPFFNEIDNYQSTPSFEINSSKDLVWKDLEQFENLLIALFVPSAKPVNNFGMDMDVVHKMAQITKSKNCQIYVFGNPLALDKIPNKGDACKVVGAYQNFEPAQRIAALHFLDELDQGTNFQP
ncbi:glycoside hydrolase family 3 protein [Cecembia calidifontis]|uniref:beta-N-acetylhexosaminidase n=1 Tax=Cecembia calidifontis TaxID=1187080 RepID=A0A4Q7P9J1_9BACT|nr:glycoside hydrolase family 3 protein [Cecembia calidifontis]RZS96831.1 beta-glucosidase-like glycosyl hydrolase [Cecembia calidifontis]